MVTKNGEYYGVNYSEFPALFIEAIKEQQKIILDLKSKIAQRDQKLEDLFSEVSKLRNQVSMSTDRLK